MTATLIRVCAVLADVIGDPAQEITDTSDLSRDLMLDSLDMIEITMALEDEFGIELEDAELAACVTVADLVRLADQS